MKFFSSKNLIIQFVLLATPFLVQAQMRDMFYTPDYKWGYKDSVGHVVIQPTLDSANPFSEGLASVSPTVYHWGFINPSGTYVIPAVLTNAKNFGEGLAAVKVNEKWGFIDKSANFVIPKQYDNAGVFHDGLCPVQVGDYWFYIDKTGRKVFEIPNTEWGYDFSNGLAGIMINHQVGFVNTSGEMVIPIQYKLISECGEGLIGVKDNTNHWGFIDATGKNIIPCVYDDASIYWESQYYFSEGLAVVKQGDNWFFIDKTGKKILDLPKDIEEAYPFRNGKSRIITTSGGEKYIDIPKFESAVNNAATQINTATTTTSSSSIEEQLTATFPYSLFSFKINPLWTVDDGKRIYLTLSISDKNDIPVFKTFPCYNDKIRIINFNAYPDTVKNTSDVKMKAMFKQVMIEALYPIMPDEKKKTDEEYLKLILMGEDTLTTTAGVHGKIIYGDYFADGPGFPELKCTFYFPVDAMGTMGYITVRYRGYHVDETNFISGDIAHLLSNENEKTAFLNFSKSIFKTMVMK